MKKIASTLLICCLLFLLQGCNERVINIQSTNLSNILIDNISIGDSIKNINLDKYTKGERYSGDYEYLFNEIVIGEDESNNTVDYIFSRFDEDYTVISVNGNKELNNIEDISKLLGYSYNEQWEDKGQGLKSRIYYDTVRNIKSEFIYLSYDDSLCWIKVSRLK